MGACGARRAITIAAMTSTDPHRPLRVVSVSRGSRHRDARLEMTLLGRHVVLERRGVDGDLRAAARLYRELAPEVDVFGLGGADLFVELRGRRYFLRESVALARHAGDTPVVCGAGLKDTLERRAVAHLDPLLGWRGRRVLVTSAIDRYGLAEALEAHGAELVLGDLAFLLGVPIRMHSLTRVRTVARLLAPVMTQLPFDWIYPTGHKQEASVGGWRTRWMADAEVVAGDYLFLGRYLPDSLAGRTVLTNTTTRDDVERLRGLGARRLVTTTPRIDGRSLATNLLEAAFVAIAGRHPLSRADYEALLDEAGLVPDVLELNPAAGEAAPTGEAARARPA